MCLSNSSRAATYTQELEVNLTNASLFTLLPPLANIVVASFVGPLADNAIERGVEVSTVRKGAQAVAFLGPASFMVGWFKLSLFDPWIERRTVSKC